jgi:hypothetical protein
VIIYVYAGGERQAKRIGKTFIVCDVRIFGAEAAEIPTRADELRCA